MLTNQHNIPLPIAVWLACDDYLYDPDPKVISATSLLRPIRSLVLAQRDTSQRVTDIHDVVASRLGTATHTAVEVAWLTKHQQAMKALGYPQSVIDQVRINPDQPSNSEFDIYIEQRVKKKIGNYIISGQFDFVVGGVLHDIKTTKTYSIITGSNDLKYIQQGSIYKWLNPEIITQDYMYINYLFTDWSPMKALADRKEYPQSKVVAKKFNLMGLQETELFIKNRLNEIQQYMHVDQSQLPRCIPKELWQNNPKYAWYKDPTKTRRATKLFESKQEAMIHNAQNGSTGLIVERLAEPTFCKYCPANHMCTQAEGYIADGLLTL